MGTDQKGRQISLIISRTNVNGHYTPHCRGHL